VLVVKKRRETTNHIRKIIKDTISCCHFRSTHAFLRSCVTQQTTTWRKFAMKYPLTNKSIFLRTFHLIEMKLSLSDPFFFFFSFLLLQVYIVGHMPPGSDERQFGANSNNGHTTYSEKNNIKYLRLIRTYSSIIQGQFFGHLHSDSFRIVYDDGKFFSSSLSYIFHFYFLFTS
jgi:hypothetical protein